VHDPDARAIAKGRLGRAIEFGCKARVLDNDQGIVLDRSVEHGNPADAPQLAPALSRVIACTRQRSRMAIADSGYGEAAADNALREVGVRSVVIRGFAARRVGTARNPATQYCTECSDASSNGS
jgi:transposase, IS5 family